jgi:hypothetical protein
LRDEQESCREKKYKKVLDQLDFDKKNKNKTNININGFVLKKEVR